MGMCFWILTNEAVVIPDSLHILAVVAAPELFGESEESIQKTFKGHDQNQNSNVESAAREEVLLRVVSRNNIRIRKNLQKCNQHWSIQLYRLTQERDSAICNWAKHAVVDGDQYADVVIHELHNNSKTTTSIDHLAQRSRSSESPVIVKQSDLVCMESE